MKQLIRIEKADQGFSLVTVLLLVALLTIVLVAFGALLSISLTSSDNAELRAQARQNAIAAMGQALGELQKDMGPDQRVSAPASILDNTGTDNTNIITRIRQPNWTGAWLTTSSTTPGDVNNAPAIDISGSSAQVIPSNYYTSGSGGFKAQHFLRWLVSAPLNNNQTLDGSTPSIDVTSAYLPQNLPAAAFSDSNSVILVGEGSSGSLTVSATASSSGTNPIEVRAWKVKGDMYYRGQKIDQNTYNSLTQAEKNLVQSGNFAWWVGDEGVKAKINLISRNLRITGTETVIELRTSLASAPTNNISAVNGYSGTTSADVQKIVTFNTMPLVYTNTGSVTISSNFHDFTAYSKGVLADVKSGGLKKDLTLLLESSTLPSSYVYSATSTGNVYTYIAPSVPVGCLKTEGPNWGLIYRYYNLYKSPYLKLDPDGVFALEVDNYNYSQFFPLITSVAGSSMSNAAQFQILNSQTPSNYRDYILPIPVRIQHVFALFADKPNYWSNVFNISSPTISSGFPPVVSSNPNYFSDSSQKVYYLGFYPAMTLWNPYNVRIRSNTTTAAATQYAISSGNVLGLYWHIPPMPITIALDSGVGPKKISDMFWVNGTPGPLYDLAMGYYFGANGLPYTLEPGALQVFGPSTSSLTAHYYAPNHGSPLPFTLIKQSTPVGGFQYLAATGSSSPAFASPGVIRANNLQLGWNPQYPFHSYQLGTATGGVATVIGTNNPTAFNAADNQNSPYIPASVTLGNIMVNSSTAISMAISPVLYYEYGALVGTQEYNPTKSSIQMDSNTYPTISGFPAVNGASSAQPLGNLGNNPYYLFTYNFNKKVYPDDTAIRSRQALFFDPLEQTSMIADPGATSAQLAPFEVTIDRIDQAMRIVGGSQSGKPSIKINVSKNNSGYFGGDLSTGVYNLVYKEIPTTPLVSLPQLQQVALGRDYSNSIYQLRDGNQGDIGGGYSSFNPSGTPTPAAATFNWVVGNGYAHPLLQASTINNQGYGDGRSFDQCFYANNALFDSYFFSTITAQPQSVAAFKNSGNDLTVKNVLDNFLNGIKMLYNNRLIPWLSDEETNATVEADLLGSANGTTIDPDAYTKSAAYLMADGAFNVNSTSVAAWTAVLAGTMNRQVNYMPPLNPGPATIPNGNSYGAQGIVADTVTSGIPFMRFLLPNNVAAESNSSGYWNGYRRLGMTQIQTVAQQLVAQIKMRGPFFSLAEFVNRQISNNNQLNQNGSLQAALDAAGVNNGFNNNDTITGSDLINTTYQNTAAAQGARGSGLPGYLTQADVLTPIANSLSARSDTFVIRSYGEVTKGGKILSRAWCEAIVQRLPDYVETKSPSAGGSGDYRYTPYSQLASSLNRQFGRKFKVIQFRWLSQDEI